MKINENIIIQICGNFSPYHLGDLVFFHQSLNISVRFHKFIYLQVTDYKSVNVKTAVIMTELQNSES